MSYFLLSFTDERRDEGEQFLGACLVNAPTFEGAVATAWVNEINPGGKVVGHELSEEADGLLERAPVDWTGKLLNLYELRAMEHQLGAMRE